MSRGNRTRTELELERPGLLSLGSVSVTVRVTVYCSDRGRQFDRTDVFERVRCDCEAA